MSPFRADRGHGWPDVTLPAGILRSAGIGMGFGSARQALIAQLSIFRAFSKWSQAASCTCRPNGSH
jgi:hypothetical protein